METKSSGGVSVSRKIKALESINQIITTCFERVDVTFRRLYYKEINIEEINTKYTKESLTIVLQGYEKYVELKQQDSESIRSTCKRITLYATLLARAYAVICRRVKKVSRKY